ncbi:MAG: CpaB family protein [Acidimicrobiales bacterium]
MKNKTVMRGALALLAALALVGFVLHSTVRQRLYPVLLVTQHVAMGAPIGPQDLGTLYVAAVPYGAATNIASVSGLYAQVPLDAGSTLATAEVGPPLHAGHGQMQLVLPVSAAQSGLVSTGEMVSVYAMTAGASQQSSVTELIPSARVLGAYTASGSPITAQAPGSPALVSLAVTPAQAATLLPYVSGSGQGSSIWLLRAP